MILERRTMLYDTILVFDWKNLKNSENPPENLSLG
jgi:hypothetical protein